MCQTWPAGFFPRGKEDEGFLSRSQSHPSMRASFAEDRQSCGNAEKIWSTGHAADGMRQTWSTGFLPCSGDSRLADSVARQTHSGFFPRQISEPSPGNSLDHRKEDHGRAATTGTSRLMMSRWRPPTKWKQRSAFNEDDGKGFSIFLVWDGLLQALTMQDAGPLAAVSRACFAQLRHELGVACRESRQCIVCGDSFTYLEGWKDCRYHPGQEQVSLVGDGPSQFHAGMMDISWTCCGKGAAIAVGIAMPCTQAEIPGCCTRNHRASKAPATIEAILEARSPRETR